MQTGSEKRDHTKACGPDMEVDDIDPVSAEFEHGSECILLMQSCCFSHDYHCSQFTECFGTPVFRRCS